MGEGGIKLAFAERYARERDNILAGVAMQREAARTEMFRQILSKSKSHILAEASAKKVDITKYETYYDLAEAIVSSQYPNLSDNPNS